MLKFGKKLFVYHASLSKKEEYKTYFIEAYEGKGVIKFNHSEVCLDSIHLTSII